jgi:hypothetical protein
MDTMPAPPQQAPSSLPIKVVKKDRFSAIGKVSRDKAIAILGHTDVTEEDIEMLNTERRALMVSINDKLKAMYVMNCTLANFPANVPRSFSEFGSLYATYSNFDKEDPIAKAFDYVMKAGFIARNKYINRRLFKYDEQVEREIMEEFSYEYDEKENPVRRGFIRRMVNHIKGDLDSSLNRRRKDNAKSSDGLISVIRRRSDIGTAVTLEDKKKAAKRKPMTKTDFDVEYVQTTEQKAWATELVDNTHATGLRVKKQRLQAIKAQIKLK